jgi:G3E family GTPase
MHATRSEQVPVTVLCGTLGAGKTTLVNNLLNDPGGRRIAVIVNDMGEVNVDAELIEAEEEGIVDLSNGCICCRLSGDLLEQARRLAREREFDYLVVEASGISEPLPIARTLTTSDDEADPPESFALDTIAAVIDAFGFWKAFDPEESLPEGAPDPQRPLTEVMVDQIEFCNVLLLNKCDMVPDDALAEIEATIEELQPEAVRYRTVHANVDPEAVLGTGRFDLQRAKRAPGWKQILAGADGQDDHAADGHDHGDDPTTGGHDHGDGSTGGGHDHGDQPAAKAHGVESLVYERAEPFDPEAFDTWLDDWDGSVIRVKGFAWVSSRPEEVLGVNQAGPAVQAGPLGEWGDREPLTKLVLIGRDLDEDRISAELDGCLADEETPEVTRDADPFPRES